MKVAVIMGSKSDLPQLEKTLSILADFGVEAVPRVMSAHRTPELAADFAEKAESDGFGVIIAAAGKAAHLAGVLAAHTVLPVIGLPIKSSTMDGLDSLLSTVQMPEGIPVATVAINGRRQCRSFGGADAGAVGSVVNAKLHEYKKSMVCKVMEADEEVRQQYSK